MATLSAASAFRIPRPSVSLVTGGPAWRPIFHDFDVVRDWLAKARPDAMVVIDHVTSFFFDHYSAFTLGVGDRYEVEDEGAGRKVAVALAVLPRARL